MWLWLQLFLLLLLYKANCDELESNEYRTKVLHSFINSTDALNNHPMGDVLVIVHSNYNSSLAQMQTYFKLWRPTYPHIVFFANWNSQELQILRKHDLPVFRCPENDEGLLAQIVMLKALHKFQLPVFKGYLYIHDDVVLNPIKMQKYDKNKFWIADYRKKQKLNDLPNTPLTTLNYNEVLKV